jgi:hypothetical protein
MATPTDNPADLATAWETQVDRLRSAMEKLNLAREEALAGHRQTQEGIVAQEIVIANMQEDIEQLTETLEIYRKAAARADDVATRMDDIGDDFAGLWDAAIEHVIQRAEGDITEQDPARLRDALEGALGRTLRAVLASITAAKRNEILQLIVDGLIEGPASKPVDAYQSGKRG